MHFEIWWAFAFVLGLTGIQSFTRITLGLIERKKSAPPRALEEVAQNVVTFDTTADLTKFFQQGEAWVGVWTGNRVHVRVRPATMARTIGAALFLTGVALIVRTR